MGKIIVGDNNKKEQALLSKKEQELMMLAVFAIGLLEAAKPGRTGRDYLKITGFGISILFSLSYLAMAIFSYITNLARDNQPKEKHLTKENLETIYNEAPLSHIWASNLICFDKKEMQTDMHAKKTYIDFHAKEVRSISYATCKVTEQAHLNKQPTLNCETEAKTDICRQIQQEYCDWMKIDGLLEKLDKFSSLNIGALSVGTLGVLTGLALLLKSERDRLRLPNAIISEAGIVELKRIGGLLQVRVEDNANINDLIDAFKRVADKLHHEMAGVCNPYRFYQSPANVEEVKDFDPANMLAYACGKK